MNHDKLEEAYPREAVKPAQPTQCDAGISEWDPWLSQFYYETLYEECKGKLN